MRAIRDLDTDRAEGSLADGKRACEKRTCSQALAEVNEELAELESARRDVWMLWTELSLADGEILLSQRSRPRVL